MTGQPPGPDRLGLPAERTVLAWQRTGLASAALSGVALLACAHDGSPALLAVVAVLAAGCTAAGTVAARPPRSTGWTPSPWPRILAAALAAGLLGLTGLLLALTALLC